MVARSAESAIIVLKRNAGLHLHAMAASRRVQ
jgi:hypothetical protein